MQENNLMEVHGLKKYFWMGNGAILKAVDDISFEIRKGETLGLVGESGCGKSTVGRTLLRLYPPDGGTITYHGKELMSFEKVERKRFTQQVQMVFQDPYASLDPRMTVGDIIGEGMDIHRLCNGKERSDRIYQLLRRVGLGREHASRFPHEFSGGQRQRVGIARALATNPEFIICDEPISALDVSIQAQVVNLLIELQKEMGLTYLFIAHDLSMVKHISDRVAVMYSGGLVELAESEVLYRSPIHPYTQALLSAIPIPDPTLEQNRRKLRQINGGISLPGDRNSPINPPPGCRLKGRCAYASAVCGEQKPALREVADGHWVACHNR